MAFKTWPLKTGETLKEPVVFVQEPYIRFNGTVRPDISTITDPVYLNKNLQSLAIDQVRFKKTIPLQVLNCISGRRTGTRSD